MHISPVILSGGNGTRLWPMSRGGYPKQYLSLHGSHTLLQQTVLRLHGVANVTAPLVISNSEQRFLVAEQLRQVGVTASSIVLEPVGRNTAPAIAVAALLALRDEEDAMLLVLPSDHVVLNGTAFVDVVQRAARMAAEDCLVTIGVEPTGAETGFGYIRAGAPHRDIPGACAVEQFVEKPDLATAEGFLGEGGYFWNSGMFMFRAAAYMAELREHDPYTACQAEMAVSRATRDADFVRLDEEAFSSCHAVSIDYAILEKTDKAAVVIAKALGWNDIGSWSALADIGQPDEAGNVMSGDVLTEGVTDSYIRAEHRMVAAVGLQDIVIVETADAVLVAHRDRTQDVRKIVEQLNATGRHESITHRRVVRPWGSYEGIDRGERFQVKRIVVNPSAQLSLQMHHHRAEHWIVVRGTALVTNGERQIMLSENESTYIPLGTTHRLSNPGKIPLELIEVQSGAYLGEDDIVRFEDTYGRAPGK